MIFHDFKKCIAKRNSIRLFLCFMPFFPLKYKREVKKAISLFFHLKTDVFSFWYRFYFWELSRDSLENVFHILKECYCFLPFKNSHFNLYIFLNLRFKILFDFLKIILAILWKKCPRRFIIFLNLWIFIFIFSFICFLLFWIFMILKNDFFDAFKSFLYFKGCSLSFFFLFIARSS